MDVAVVDETSYGAVVFSSSGNGSSLLRSLSAKGKKWAGKIIVSFSFGHCSSLPESFSKDFRLPASRRARRR